MYRPIETATAGLLLLLVVVVAELLLLLPAGSEDWSRWRSPRMQTSAWTTVLPPRIMCWVPWTWERRETLLPVSW